MEGMIGEVRIFAGTFAPRTWAFCNGQLLSIAENQALFSILGTIYGGDGRTTFALPDLRGRTVIGPGNGPGLPSYREGQKGGNYETTLNTTNMPSHNHGVAVNLGAGPATENIGAGNKLAVAATDNIYNNANNAQVLGGVTQNNAGGGQSFSNMQPYTPVYYIICLYGVFPSRS